MKTYDQLKQDVGLEESITSALYKLARMSADARAVKQSVKQGSLSPIEKRLLRKALGRKMGKLYRIV